MRRSTAFPGMGRAPPARSRVRVVVLVGTVICKACEVPSAKCGDQKRRALGAPTPRTSQLALRTWGSRAQSQHPLMRPERLQHERDVLIERGAGLLHPLRDVLAAHPFGESLVL